MRNLITSHRGSLAVQSQDVPDLPLAVASFDPITDSIICAFGQSDEFKSIEIQQHFVSICRTTLFIFSGALFPNRDYRKMVA
jgi:hypothetical protein